MNADRDPSPPQRKRRFVRGGLLLGAALLGIVVWSGSDRVPADPNRPLPVAGEAVARDKSGPLRVATFNIHGGKGRDRRRDLGRTAECLADVDFAGLNEVHASFLGDNQAAELGRRLGMTAVFAATERRWWHDHFGNALLARHRLTGCHRIPLPGTQGKKYRNAVLANLDFRGRIVRLLVVHLDRVTDREAQLQAVIDLYLSLTEPAVLLGDLNTPPSDPALQRLLATPGVQSALDALGAGAPDDNIDWIIHRGLRCRRAAYRENDASDHPVVIAELELPADVSTTATVDRRAHAMAISDL